MNYGGWFILFQFFVVKRTPDFSIILDLSKKNCRRMHVERRYELGTYRLIRRMANVCDAFIDGGAHVGYFSKLATPLYRKVVAVEASADNYRLLKRNVAPEVLCYQAALFSKNGHVVFYENADSDGGHSLYPGNVKRIRASNKVCTVTLETIIREHPDANKRDIFLVKLDIQGAELDALNDVDESRHNLFFICELWDNKRTIFKWFIERGYVAYLIKRKLYKYTCDALEIPSGNYFFVPQKLQHLVT